MSKIVNNNNIFYGNPVFGDNNNVSQSCQKDVYDKDNLYSDATLSQVVKSGSNAYPKRTTVFISYSWEDEKHNQWVRTFAEDLKSRGIDVIYDQDIKNGTSLPMFMQKSINKADSVLIIGTPMYLQKSTKKGTGCQFEDAIITDSLYVEFGTTKYIPILRSGTFDTSFPSLVAHRKGLDFRNDRLYEEKMEELVKSLI